MAEELEYEFYMSDLAVEIWLFHNHGRIRILWKNSFTPGPGKVNPAPVNAN